MNLRRTLFAGGLALLAVPSLATAADWLQFRGNDVSGVVPDAQIPVDWDLKSSRSVAWQADLTGRGLSSPIIAGGRVFLTSSSGYRQDRLHVLCFDEATGQRLWVRTFVATGRTMCHDKMAVATPTPASDGRRIYASFSSNDVVCLDFDGNLQWYRGLTHDFPNASNSLGMSSSPVIAGSTLVVQVENDAESFATGLDLETGESRWKKDRPQRANWTSPVVLKTDGRAAVLLQSSAGLEAVEADSGERLWNYDKGASTIPSSVIADDMVFVPSNGLTVLRTGGEVLWSDTKLSPGTASPIVVQKKVFVVNRAGVVNCNDGLTGSALWKLRLEGSHSASPVAAGKLVVFVNEAGKAQVVDIEKEGGEIVGTSDFGETVLATPSIAGNALFVRSDQHLWKVAAAPAGK